jgi:hypothetical protein
MNSPEAYIERLAQIYIDLRCDIIDLLNTKYNGHYNRQNNEDPFIKQSNIIGTPIIYELKVDNGQILYKAGSWSGNFLICTQKEYYTLQNEGLFEVYKTLHQIAFSEENC